MSTKPMAKKTGKAPEGKRAAAAPIGRVERFGRIAGDVDPGIAKLKQIVRILEESTLGELRYEDGDIVVEVARQALLPSASPANGPATPLAALSRAPAAALPSLAFEAMAVETKAEVAEARDVHVVRSPFIGTFYASPSPDADPFTAVGKQVRRGQTLCIIEAMKLMNEIESEVDGTVLEIFAENGKPVQYGDALFKIKVKAG